MSLFVILLNRSRNLWKSSMGQQITIIIYSFKKTFACACICGLCVKARGQLGGVGSLLPSCGAGDPDTQVIRLSGQYLYLPGLSLRLYC